MQQAPRIVVERLKAEMPAANHPDADMLTAFAEKSLPKLDRGIVLEHLALCSECREIVALAAPEPDHDLEIIEELFFCDVGDGVPPSGPGLCEAG